MSVWIDRLSKIGAVLIVRPLEMAPLLVRKRAQVMCFCAHTVRARVAVAHRHVHILRIVACSGIHSVLITRPRQTNMLLRICLSPHVPVDVLAHEHIVSHQSWIINAGIHRHSWKAIHAIHIGKSHSVHGLAHQVISVVEGYLRVRRHAWG